MDTLTLSRSCQNSSGYALCRTQPIPSYASGAKYAAHESRQVGGLHTDMTFHNC